MAEQARLDKRKGRTKPVSEHGKHLHQIVEWVRQLPPGEARLFIRPSKTKRRDE